jgi:hypothetical protein
MHCGPSHQGTMQGVFEEKRGGMGPLAVDEDNLTLSDSRLQSPLAKFIVPDLGM